MVNFSNKKVVEVVIKRLNNLKFNPLTNTHFINNSNLKKLTSIQEKNKIEMHESHSKTPFIKKH
tara:strand:+ start:3296 stop:3487 length:192 start_codon:yes stop_codon:yes gene_type:complete